MYLLCFEHFHCIQHLNKSHLLATESVGLNNFTVYIPFLYISFLKLKSLYHWVGQHILLNIGSLHGWKFGAESLPESSSCCLGNRIDNVHLLPNCSIGLNWLVITLAMLGKMFLVAAVGMGWIHIPEFYPTVVRSAGFNIGSTSARIGGIAASYIGLLVI